MSPNDTKHRDEHSVSGEPDAHHPDPEVRKRFFGKYRGSVAVNVDPLSQGRLMLQVPDVLGVATSSWAMPCVPMAGPMMGTYFVPPPIGAGVWVEFEQGDAAQPIWVGCYWSPGQIPPLAQTSAKGAPTIPTITLETATSGISICDVPLPPGGNLNLHAGPSTYITLGADGITIAAPSVKLLTPMFTVNGAHLTVI